MHQEQEIEGIISQRLELRENIRQKEQELYKLENLNRANETKIQELDSRSQALNLEKQTQQEIIKRQGQKIKEWERQGAQLREAIRKKEGELARIEEAKNNMAEKILQLQSRLEELSRENESGKTTIINQQKEIEKNTLQYSGLENKIKGLEDINQSLTAKKTQLESELNELNQDNQTKQKTILKEQKELQDALTRYSKLEKELERQQQDAQNFQDISCSKNQKLKYLATNIAELKKKNQTDEKLISRQKQQIEESQEQVSQLQDILKGKKEEIQNLDALQKAAHAELKNTESQIKELEKKIETQRITIEELKKQSEIKKERAVQPETGLEKNGKLKKIRKDNQEKLPEVLLKNKLVNKEVLNKALEFQNQEQGNLLRFLCVNHDINENKLAECISQEFKVPFMPLASYEISDQAVKIIPLELAEEYWLLAIDKTGDSIVVVMVDPFDNQAIKKIEELTGCTVQVYVGLLSEIAQKIRYYYKVNIRGLDAQGNLISPLFIKTRSGKGRERRRAVRFKIEIPLRVSKDAEIFATTTEDICLEGISFKLDHELPIYSTVTLQLNIPQEEEGDDTAQLPVLALAEVRRSTQIKKNDFVIGAKLVKAEEDEIKEIIDYVCAQQAGTN